jgi:hypothetical protein
MSYEKVFFVTIIGYNVLGFCCTDKKLLYLLKFGILFVFIKFLKFFLKKNFCCFDLNLLGTLIKFTFKLT